MKTTNQKIYISSGKGPSGNIKDVLSKIDPAAYRDKTILIKPNVGRQTTAGRGINTHPEAVAAAIEVLRDGGAGEIAIGESPIIGVNTMDAFQSSGITEIAEKYDCPLIDLDAGSAVKKEIPGGWVLDHTKICSEVFSYDLLLSLPVAKCHMHTGVTLGIKNMKGCLYKREKIRYHQLEKVESLDCDEKTLDIAISDLATILLPDITVIDGFIGMEGLGPSGGDPVESNFAVASLNPMGADVAGCIMMGKDPAAVPHLKLISSRQGFSLNADDYAISPSNYKKNIVEFKEPPTDIALEYPDVVLYDQDSCSACLSTVMFFLKRFKDDVSEYLPEDSKLHLAIGKGIKDIKIADDTVLIGNCAKCLSSSHRHVKGCPPVPTRIFKEITGEEPPDNEPDIK